ncbi:MAG: thioredoxin family protein [Deltaproteobacteria bacterium]|nr:thioredoxin family protein [Candidatus Anaeroferrophillacea bacterium]
MELKVFVQDACPRCPAAKDLAADIAAAGGTVNIFDTGAAAGLAEASFFGIMATPSLLVVDNDDRVVGAWRGTVPGRDEVDRLLRGNVGVAGR